MTDDVFTYRFDRRPEVIVFAEEAEFKDTYGGDENIVLLEAHHLVPDGNPSDTILIFMHPVGRVRTCRWWGRWPGPATTSSTATPATAPATWR